ncbi:MAG: MarR family transcriptional regulator [Bacilli bacterium]|jgi:DNA-binding MarR family transcriptional regulator|nr:MarR family transcriptional regulator [Bacilli bacterium]
MANKYDVLKIENQICFPLYAASKEIVRQYQPFLDELDLTYTQYITMLVLWEYGDTNIKKLGEYLLLDSGTLTPLVKKLEEKGYVIRHRKKDDERNLIISLTNKGEELKEKAVEVPYKIGSCVCLEPEEAKALYSLLYKVLGKLKKE